MAELRKDLVEAALAVELARQGSGHGIDVAALADAVLAALSGTFRGVQDEGRRPDELNSSNDD